MDEIKIKLTKEQYKILVKHLYFSDYSVDRGLSSDFQETEEKNKLFDLLKYLYSFRSKFNLPETISLATITSPLPMSEKENLRLLKRTEADFEKIMTTILSRKFAERDLNLPPNNKLFNHEGGWMSKNELVGEKMQLYIKEFEENGIENLRFKLFKNPKDAED